MSVRRPPILRAEAIRREEPVRHPFTQEPMGLYASFGRAAGFARLAAHHVTLLPGWRSSPPHAERDEDEMVFVLSGAPTLWQDGRTYPLRPGLAVVWPAGTGVAHSILNDGPAPAEILCIGEGSRYASQFDFPLDAALRGWAEGLGKLWTDAKRRTFGPHDGLTAAMRGAPSPVRPARGRPANVVDWPDVLGPDDQTYPGSEEKLCITADLARGRGLSRIGGGVDVLRPGRRTSWPHAEFDEEEFVYVLSGEPTLWQNGRVYPLRPGDFVGWPAGTGDAHCLINDSSDDVHLLVFGEASLARSRVWYPLHPKRMKEIGERAWVPARPPSLGPHDGKPEGLRARSRRAKSAR